jgi:hypothetical protein
LARTRINRCVLYVILVFLSPPELLETRTLTPTQTIMLAAVLTPRQVLQNIRYNIPTNSSVRIATLNVGLQHDIGLFYVQLAEDNMNDVISLITYI